MQCTNSSILPIIQLHSHVLLLRLPCHCLIFPVFVSDVDDILFMFFNIPYFLLLFTLFTWWMFILLFHYSLGLYVLKNSLHKQVPLHALIPSCYFLFFWMKVIFMGFPLVSIFYFPFLPFLLPLAIFLLYFPLLLLFPLLLDVVIIHSRYYHQSESYCLPIYSFLEILSKPIFIG